MDKGKLRSFLEAELWTLWESAYLLCGREPLGEGDFIAHERDRAGDVGQAYRALKDATLAASLTFIRADAADTLMRRRVRPREVMLWAESRGLTLPPFLLTRRPTTCPARWHVWRHVPMAELWQCVALSLDIEPDERFTLEAMGRAPQKELPPEFFDRLQICMANVAYGGPIDARPSVGEHHTVRRTVRVAEVVAFLASNGFPIPDAIRAMGEAKPKPKAPPAPPAADAPLPLTTGDVAFCFADLRWSEAQWKKQLGNKPQWLKACVAIPGQRGVSETRWDPVRIGAALVRAGHAEAHRVRARFQSKPLLKPWLDAWKTYEADYIDTD